MRTVMDERPPTLTLPCRFGKSSGGGGDPYRAQCHYTFLLPLDGGGYPFLSLPLDAGQSLMTATCTFSSPRGERRGPIASAMGRRGGASTAIFSSGDKTKTARSPHPPAPVARVLLSDCRMGSHRWGEWELNQSSKCDFPA